jgi:SET domain-containing protein
MFYVITKEYGKYINHCLNSNTNLVKPNNSNIFWMVASKDIKKGDEITADYNKTPYYISKPKPYYKNYC